MISNHLSMIEELRPVSDELAAQIAEFVAAGGEIEVAEPPPPPKPVVYVPQEPRRRSHLFVVGLKHLPCPSTRMTSAPGHASSLLSRYASSASRTPRPKSPLHLV